MTGAGGAGGTDGAAGRLERGYRRLLACYPPRHRREHGEEMLGVLLAAAPDEQRRPTWRETADLLRGAALIWLAPHGSRAADAGWRDALAIVSVALPLAALLQAGSSPLFLYAMGPGQPLYLAWTPLIATLVYGMAGQGILIPLVLLRLRRTAAFVALLMTIALTAWSASALIRGLAGGGIPDVTLAAFPMFSYGAEAAALLLSAGPRRGLRLVTWRGTALLAAGALAAGLIEAVAYAFAISGSIRRFLTSAYPPPPSTAVLAAITAAAGLVLVLAAITAARAAAGRRVLIILAIPACALLSRSDWWPGPVSQAAAGYLPALAITVLALVAARRSRRSRRDRPTGTDPDHAVSPSPPLRPG